MHKIQLAPCCAIVAAVFSLSFADVRAGEDKIVKEADGRVIALEEKINLLEKRIKDLEANANERMAPPNRFGQNNGGMNEMLEQLQREMMRDGLDRFGMPNVPGGPRAMPGPRGNFNRAPGRKPRLGVELDQVRADLKTQFKNEVKDGAFVMSVVPGSPADKAGLQVGDAITSFDGKAVIDPQSVIEAVKDAPKGAREIIVSRRGELLTLKVELGNEVVNDPTQDDTVSLDNNGWLRRGDPDMLGGVKTQTELKVSALELKDNLAREMKLSDEQKIKATEVLAKHQKALSAEFETSGGMKKKARGGMLQFNMTGNLNELAQKHADAAAKELAGVFNEEQLAKWNTYRAANNSVSFSQSTTAEAFGGPNKPKRLEKQDDAGDAKF